MLLFISNKIWDGMKLDFPVTKIKWSCAFKTKKEKQNDRGINKRILKEIY